MTTPKAQETNPPESTNPLPTAAHLFAHTDWAALEHGLAGQVDLAQALTKLLADDKATRARALSDIQQAAHHQNTIYPATTAVALYIAALLSDPRTEAVGAFGHGEHPRQLRAALLDWLGDMAYDVGEDSSAAARRLGFETRTEELELRSVRPKLLAAATPFTRAPDADVRHAAVTTVLLLLETAEERRCHQTEYTPLVEEILTTSSSRYHRARAIDSLDAWGQDTTMLRREDSIGAGNGTNGWPAWSEEPPF